MQMRLFPGAYLLRIIYETEKQSWFVTFHFRIPQDGLMFVELRHSKAYLDGLFQIQLLRFPLH
jgi:hypothetical protein